MLTLELDEILVGLIWQSQTLNVRSTYGVGRGFSSLLFFGVIPLLFVPVVRIIGNTPRRFNQCLKLE
jgi:hypothetical protein